MRNTRFKISIFSLFLYLLTVPIYAQSVRYRFYQKDIADGLSQNDVMCFFRDSKEYMWIGTQSGLNRFDGYNFIQYKSSNTDTNSLTNNIVTKIVEDNRGNLWIATVNGLTRYHYSTNTFHKYFESGKDTTQLNSNYITDILLTSSGEIWIVGGGGGIHRYRPDTDDFERYTRWSKTAISQNVNNIIEDDEGHLLITENSGYLITFNYKLKQLSYTKVPFHRDNERKIYAYRDRLGKIWLYNKKELLLFNASAEGKSFKNIELPSDIIDGLMNDIAQDDDGNYWISTLGNGIFIADSAFKRISRLIVNPLNRGSTSTNMFYSIYFDSNETTWLGSQKHGFYFRHPDMEKFQLYQYDTTQYEGINKNAVGPIFQDSYKQLWVGTGSGLNKFNPGKGTFERLSFDFGNVSCIAEDDEKGLWIGTYSSGVYVFNLNSERITHFTNIQGNENSLSCNEIWSIYRDKENTLWVGTIGNGINRYNKKAHSFTRFEMSTPLIRIDFIRTIYEDSRNNFWLGKAYALVLLDRNTYKFKYFINQINDPNSLSEDHVQCIYEDTEGYLWIGTYDGLNLFDYDKGIFKSFTTREGLPGNMICSILEDTLHYIWISTNNGISRIRVNREQNLQDVTIKTYNFYETDGLQGTEFHTNSACVSAEGMFYFGGPNGLNAIDPYNIVENKATSKIAVTGFSLFNKKVMVGEEINGRVILKNDISETTEINLKYRENVISLEFSALDYINADKIDYSYFLEGFNDRWIQTTSNDRIATFTNLNPGLYTFHVRASNRDGSWNKNEAGITIRVQPPWYLSRWAEISYVVIFILLLLMLRHFIIRRERLNSLIREERITIQRQNELNDLKNKFFTNISHELRTPLTLITAPIEALQQKSLSEEVKDQIDLIYKNAKRLIHMVNQVLDFRKLEAGQTVLSTSYGDIVGFIKEIVHSFRALTDNKGINLQFASSINELSMHFDPDKVEKIMLNLLSNAYKYTSPGGRIGITIELTDHLTSSSGNKEDVLNEFVQIKVSDNGKGISADKKDKIFERFYQIESADNLNTGSGIGLALVKEFTEIHKGTVKVESELDKGSVFTVTLPLTEDSISVITAEGRINEDTYRKSEIISESKSIDEPVAETYSLKSVKPEEFTSRESLLIIEDNNELRKFIANIFLERFTIYEAENGTTGYNLAREKVPDLIISDIMMPGIDGIKLCKRLKEEEVTSHIPLILLTARSGEENLIKGYNTGADEYITKPFSIEVLKARVQNIIETRRKLHLKFSREILIKPEQLAYSTPERSFLKRARLIIEDNMDNIDFDVELFVEKMHTSRANIYRKIKALTNLSVKEFIRIIRLKKSAELLAENQFTIAEISYKVGFSSPSYFTKCFRQQFKTSPKNFVNKLSS